MPQDVQLTAVLPAGKLDSRNEFDAPPHGLGSSHRQGGDSVMVGDRQRRKADPRGGDDNFTWRANPVGMRCVHVQISRTVPTVPRR